jgi:Ca2+-binding EF-hand superfamily protein
MLTYETQRILKNLILEIGRGEMKLELIRQKLASFEDFEPYVAFQRVDRNRNDYIASEEILDFLKDNKIYSATIEESNYLINFFDSDEDFRLSYSE